MARDLLSLLEEVNARLERIEAELMAQGPQKLTTEQAAEFLGVSPQTLMNRRVTGRRAIPYVKEGRSVYYLRSELLKHRQTRLHT